MYEHLQNVMKGTYATKGLNVSKEIQQAFPSIPLTAYIFRGLPDFVVYRSPVIMGGDDDESSSTDGECAQVEHGFQMTPLQCKSSATGLPDKLGELIAAKY